MFESLAVRFGNMSLPLTKSFLSITAQLVNTYTIKGNTQNLVFSNLIPGAGFWSRVHRTRGLVAWANSLEICTLHPDTSAGPGQVLGLQYTIGNLKPNYSDLVGTFYVDPTLHSLRDLHWYALKFTDYATQM